MNILKRYITPPPKTKLTIYDVASGQCFRFNPGTGVFLRTTDGAVDLKDGHLRPMVSIMTEAEVIILEKAMLVTNEDL